MRRDNTTKFLETVGGLRCACGHLTNRHRKADPDFRIGSLVEKWGACSDCACKGMLDDAEEGDRA